MVAENVVEVLDLTLIRSMESGRDRRAGITFKGIHTVTYFLQPGPTSSSLGQPSK